MRDAVDELGRLVAAAALDELAQRSFGAVDGVDFVAAQQAQAGDDGYWLLTWSVTSAGLGREVRLVLLPEFLETEPELLVSQFCVLLVERALAGAPLP